MEIENLWDLVKTFYFRNENVILRVPFCFFLQLGMYFDMIVKDSKEEDTKTWYEIAGTRPSNFQSRRKNEKLVSFWLKLVHLFLPV